MTGFNTQLALPKFFCGVRHREVERLDPIVQVAEVALLHPLVGVLFLVIRQLVGVDDAIGDGVLCFAHEVTLGKVHFKGEFIYNRKIK